MEEPRARAYFDIHIGDQAAHDSHASAYDRTTLLLSANAGIYGFPLSPEELSDEQRDILEDLNVTYSSSEKSRRSELC